MRLIILLQGGELGGRPSKWLEWVNLGLASGDKSGEELELVKIYINIKHAVSKKL